MKITDLRIGDRVQEKGKNFPFIVTGLFGDKDVQAVPAVEDYEGDVWEFEVNELEFCEPRYKLPEWKKDEDCDTIVSGVELQFCTIQYVIDEYDDSVKLFFNRLESDTGFSHKIGEYPTLSEAKVAAEKHYNELVSEMIERLTFAHLTNEASKM